MRATTTRLLAVGAVLLAAGVGRAGEPARGDETIRTDRFEASRVEAALGVDAGRSGTLTFYDRHGGYHYVSGYYRGGPDGRTPYTIDGRPVTGDVLAAVAAVPGVLTVEIDDVVNSYGAVKAVRVTSAPWPASAATAAAPTAGPVLSYAAAREAARAAGKPVVLFVGCKPFPVPGAIVAHEDDLDGHGLEILVGRWGDFGHGKGFGFWTVAQLPPDIKDPPQTAAAARISQAIDGPFLEEYPAAPLVAAPPVVSTPAGGSCYVDPRTGRTVCPYQR